MNSFTFTLVRSRGGTGGAEGDVMFIPEYLENPLFILFIANLDSSWLQHHHHVWFNWRWNFLFSLFISFTFIHGKYQNRTWNKQNSHFHRYTFRLSRTLFAHLHFLSWLVALLFYFFLPQLMDLTTFSLSLPTTDWLLRLLLYFYFPLPDGHKLQIFIICEFYFRIRSHTSTKINARGHFYTRFLIPSTIYCVAPPPDKNNYAVILSVESWYFTNVSLSGRSRGKSDEYYRGECCKVSAWITIWYRSVLSSVLSAAQEKERDTSPARSHTYKVVTWKSFSTSFRN